MTWKYVIGDAVYPEGGAGWIVHVCNDVGAWGAGFSGALSDRWVNVKRIFQSAVPRLTLGCVQEVPLSQHLGLFNMVAQRGLRSHYNKIPLQYDALETCLLEVKRRILHYTRLYPQFCTTAHKIHMPRIGCGLAGGNWAEVSAVIERAWADAPFTVTVYDLKA